MKALLLICIVILCRPSISAQRSPSDSGHTHDILEVKFNSEAMELLSYSAGDGWLILWDVKSGQIIWRTKTEVIQKADEYYTLTCFAFSPDRRFIASGSGNGTVQLWDALTGKLKWRADAYHSNVSAIEFSPDGKNIASAASPEEGANQLKVLRVDDGQIIRTLEVKSCVPTEIRFIEKGILQTGNLDGSVSGWDLQTGKRSGSSCLEHNRHLGEVSFTPDLSTAAIRTGEKEITLRVTQRNAVIKRLEADGYRIHLRFSANGKKLVFSGYSGFTFYDLASGETRKIDEFSRTGSTIDLSRDGSLFAEGGSWGNAAIKLTETQTGKSWLLDGKGQRFPPHQPSELEVRLTSEKMQRRALLNARQARRDEQAAIDAKTLTSQVYISFAHYGEMDDPGTQRMMESDEPKKSKVKKPATEAGAVWLRLHNDSLLPVRIPTQSMYLPNPKCFYTYAVDKKLTGLCDGREIGVWHGLEDRNGKQLPYGFDFGSSTVLLPKTSVLFAVPLKILQNDNAIRFNYTFLKETEDHKIAEYGVEITLRFRQSDLPKDK